MLFDAPFPLILSPMDDVTDLPFRQLCKQFGADGLITEFIASEALNREAEKSRRKMLFTPEQHPIGIQIFGADEDSLLRCIDIVTDAKPDFIDINWGCPVRKVAGKGAGSGMLNDIPKLIRITAALVKRSPLPLTVKTRLGFDETNKPIVSLAEQLQDVGVVAISIHGRTKSQMYKGKADWSLIAETKANPRLHIPVFGNGDITVPEQVVEARSRYGVDGILIGRGAIGNPWIFEQSHRLIEGKPLRNISIQERVDVCKSHLCAAIEFKGEHTAMFEMRKHYGGYFYGLPHFKQFRIPLVTLTSYEALLPLFDQIVQFYSNYQPLLTNDESSTIG
ncbi:MAG: tRNA-dihydrouridine synthase family protein [Bacteroidales bacterium]|nr:tRNA-dihydrouridine synthase family protein [Bacteroidales bacterium]